jgi:hypothetical protein
METADQNIGVPDLIRSRNCDSKARNGRNEMYVNWLFGNCFYASIFFANLGSNFVLMRCNRNHKKLLVSDILQDSVGIILPSLNDYSLRIVCVCMRGLIDFKTRKGV